MKDESVFLNARILIVDDQQPNVDLLEGFLEMQGYSEVKSITDSRDVFRLFESFKPDLILLDLAMPYFTGYEIMDKLKPMIDPNTFLPILVLSANISVEAKQKALSEGASDFLSKPFDLTEVGLRIRNLLYARSLHIQLADQNQQLEERVRERTQELQKLAEDLLAAKNKAEASDRLKSSFLQTISHEIRTPMNGILGFASLLSSPDLTETEKSEFISLMEVSADRLINTITDYVDISMINSDNLETSYQRINVKKLIYEIENKYTNACKNKHLSFNLHLPSDLTEFELITDQNFLRSILSHLLANAIKFTKTGSIDLGYTVEPSVVTFFVTDTGIGIDEELQKKIFENFIQGDDSITRIFEGSGLGLSICQGFVKKLDGTIEIKSALGKGSTFSFKLPIYTDIPV